MPDHQKRRSTLELAWSGLISRCQHIPRDVARPSAAPVRDPATPGDRTQLIRIHRDQSL
jgi:hypothetical protein